MSLTTVLGITVLGHHRVNRSLRTSANLDFANRNCFDLLVKIIVTAPIARGSSLKSPLDADVVSPLAVLAKIPVRAGKPPRQRAIAQRFRALGARKTTFARHSGINLRIGTPSGWMSTGIGVTMKVSMVWDG
jgi:hypothetical protein